MFENFGKNLGLNLENKKDNSDTVKSRAKDQGVAQSAVASSQAAPATAININNSIHMGKEPNWKERRNAAQQIDYRIRALCSGIDSLNAPNSKSVNQLEQYQTLLKNDFDKHACLLKEEDQKELQPIMDKVTNCRNKLPELTALKDQLLEAKTKYIEPYF